MRRYSLGIVIILLAVGSTLGQDVDAKAVIAKAIEAHGGADALSKYNAGNTKVKGVLSLFGQDLEFTGDITYEMPDKYRMALNTEVSGQKISLVQIANGAKQKSTQNGMLLKIGDPEKAELTQAMKMQEIAQLTPLLTAKYTIKADKADKVGDVDAAVVVVNAKDFKETRLYFDTKTGLLIKSTRQGLHPAASGTKEALEETVMSDFKKFDGVMAPTKMVVTHDGSKFMTMTVVENKAMEKADPKLFDVAD